MHTHRERDEVVRGAGRACPGTGREAADAGDGTPGRSRGRLRGRVFCSTTLLGALSLIWLLVRTGRKPTRINYPCQRAALANATVLFAGTALPVAARLPHWISRGRVARPGLRKLFRAGEVAAAVVLTAAIALTLANVGSPGGRSLEEMRAAGGALTLPELRASQPGASDIYVAENVPQASENGVDQLIRIMAGNGLDFFKSGGGGAASGPGGLIAKNDIVLIKVNGEWRYRGGTNTDVVKGLVNAIVRHPDGFTGEVVIVENGQWDSYMDNRPDNRNPDACNAQDRGQSFNDVAVSFAAKGHRVSVYDWTAVQRNDVPDFNTGDARDGYVYVPEIQEGYPKFTTIFGTQISLRHGRWTGNAWEASRLKMLNVPVLKDHGGPGVTCAVKHWMGVQDLWRRTQEAPHGPMVTEGIFGKLMLYSHFPELNVADCIWVTPSGGPNGPYDRAVRLDRLVASRDPIALDYYCGKYVLMPVSGNGRHDPSAANQFNQMLSTTRDVLLAGGKAVTMDESRMNVYKSWEPDVPPPAAHEYFLAEGCTAYGFETWVLVANPNDEPATCSISYLTETGALNRAPVSIPPKSRLTVNMAADAWAVSAGVRVGSDRPVYVERAMYWSDRAEGHDSIGAAAGAREWYLADGHTADGFETWIEIMNTSGVAASARLTYMTPAGAVDGPRLTVPPHARATVFAADTVNGSEVSTKVASDVPVVVERSMYWNGRRGGMGSHGVTSPGTRWYLAEGATHSGFETYVLLFNPGTVKARVSLDLLTSGRGPATRSFEVPPGTRRTVRLNDVAPGADVSARVESDVPIVAERSMLWPVPGGRAGHSSAGVAAPARRIFLPEGCTAYGFETWLLLLNPLDRTASVTVSAMTESGERKLARLDLPAGARKSLDVGGMYVGNVSLEVSSDLPICAERSVYWNARGGGTSSIGYYSNQNSHWGQTYS